MLRQSPSGHSFCRLADTKLTARSDPIAEVNGTEQKSQSAAAQTKAAVRGWLARQQR
jgi:hypothetical protein